MGCSSCSTSDGCGKPNGGGCGGDCNKKSAYNWLSEFSMPTNPFDIVEVKFKSGRKAFYRNHKSITLITGDYVVVDEGKGNHHIGYVSLQGELVRLQLKKKKVIVNDETPKIIRLANTNDLERLEAVRSKEMNTLFKTRQIIEELSLSMKLSDVEFQADNNKATFYYSANDRVDFRVLIKELAKEFNIRIEMKQINLRQEAARLGGIGSCGRELCCSTWIHDFKKVNSSAARYQQLSINQSKLSGQCGRLKCCLNYELDSYLEGIKEIPKVKGALQTQSGYARLEKTDIFQKKMYFVIDNSLDYIELSTQRVIEIQALNKKGIKPFSLTENKASKKSKNFKN